MGRVHISNLLPGMELDADVYNNSDQLILPEGLKLNDRAIEKLAYYGIEIVRIADHPDALPEGYGEEAKAPAKATDKSSATPANSAKAPANNSNQTNKEPEKETYSERLKKTEEFKVFEEKFENAVSDVQGFLSDVVERNMPPDTTNIMNQIQQMLHPPGGDVINVFDMIHNMRAFDDMTYVHCLNVGLICNVFGKWLGLSKEEIDLATQCGILHDIGKLKIPESIIKKPSKLTDDEYNTIKSHPLEGYKILLPCDIDNHIKKACLQHHEKADGSGYPMGIRNDQMDYYSRMVCIADVYEAMTAVRVYRGSLSPFQVIDAFEREGLQKYDTKMIMTFLENISSTYMLNRVRLSDGREGDLVYINKTRLSRPTINCDGVFVDLMKESPDLYVAAIL